MRPVEFEGQTHILARDQKEYQPLPIRLEGNCCTSCWELSEEEIQTLVKTKRLWLNQFTFRQPLQPQLPSVARIDPTEFPMGY